jgi:hypothetical protein
MHTYHIKCIENTAQNMFAFVNYTHTHTQTSKYNRLLKLLQQKLPWILFEFIMFESRLDHWATLRLLLSPGMGYGAVCTNLLTF